MTRIHVQKLVVIILLQSSIAVPQCLGQITVPEESLKGVARTKFDSPKPTKAQLDHRLRNDAQIKAMGVPVLETLPVTENEQSIKPRSAEELVKRCLAVEICAVKGETDDQKLANSMIKQLAAATFFSPKEKSFVYNEHPSKQQRVNFAWQYERVHVLLWALGLIDHLKKPNEICDVAGEAKLLRGATVRGLTARAKPRSISEIMDQADLYYRLHWAATDLRLHGKTNKNIDEEIIDERHHALNWLIRYLNEQWDDVTTDT